MTVHLGHDDRTEIRAVLERTGLCLSSLAYNIDQVLIIGALHTTSTTLTDTSVQNHNSHIRLHGLPNLYHLLKQLRLLLMPSRRVHNNDLKPLLLELCHTLRRNRHWVRLGVRAKVGDLGFCRGLSRLVEGTRTEGVCADDARFEPAFLVVDGEFGAGGCFAVSLCCYIHG